jgi:hypothetical protein
MTNETLPYTIAAWHHTEAHVFVMLPYFMKNGPDAQSVAMSTDEARAFAAEIIELANAADENIRDRT